MCLIAYLPKNLEIDGLALDIALRKNRDGAGIMWSDGDRLLVDRGLSSAKDILEALIDLRRFPRILHLRHATNGDVCADNTQPFVINDKLGVVHNGIIDVPCTVPWRSDTWHFVETRLKPLYARYGPELLRQEELLTSLSKELDWNTMVMLTSQSKVVVVNEQNGEWHRGVWYSSVTNPASARLK